MVTPITGASNAGGVWKILLFSTSISLRHVLSTLRPPDVINTVPPDGGRLVTLIAGNSKQRSLSMAADGQRGVYDKKPQRYTKHNKTAFNLCSGKSVARVTNNRRVHSRYCTIEANYWQTLCEASHGIFATAELFVHLCSLYLTLLATSEMWYSSRGRGI